MGGYGSGPSGYRRKTSTENCISLDVRQLFRWSGADGVMRTCTWSRGQRELASLEWALDRDGLSLIYSGTDKGTGKARRQKYWFAATWTPCNLGGQRIWLLCDCGRRVAKLYVPFGGEPLFRCRHCLSLTYASRLDPAASAINRARAIRIRLGGGADLSKPFPERPKGMHRRTYKRLHEEYRRQEADMFAVVFRSLKVTKPWFPAEWHA